MHLANYPSRSSPTNFGDETEFLTGDYQLDVYAALVGRAASLHLHSTHLVIGEQAGIQLKDPANGIYFDWGQDAQRYQSHVRKKTAHDESPQWPALDTIR